MVRLYSRPAGSNDGRGVRRQHGNGVPIIAVPEAKRWTEGVEMKGADRLADASDSASPRFAPVTAITHPRFNPSWAEHEVRKPQTELVGTKVRDMPAVTELSDGTG
jgi:hypothetical protein